MLVVTLTLLFLLSFIGIFISKSMLSPEFISPFGWGVILLLYLVLNHGLYNLSDKVLIIVLLWNFSLFLGVLITRFFLMLKNKKIKNKRSEADFNLLSFGVYRFYYWVSIIGFFPTLYIIYKQTQAIGGDFFYSLRMANTGIIESDISLGIFIYVYVFANIAYFTEFILIKKGSSKKRFVILLLINFILAITTASKSAFLFFMISTLVIYLLKNKIFFPNFKVVKYSFVTIILMISIQTLRDSGSSAKIDGSTLLYTYLLGGLPALDKIVNSEMSSSQFGQNTFSLVINFLKKIGFKENISKNYVNDITYDSYINVPYPTNVYTVIGPIWLDFSYLGVVLSAFFVGILVCFFYIEANKKSWALIVYGYLFCILVLQFFGEYIFTNMSLLLQIILLSYLLYFFSNRKLVWK